MLLYELLSQIISHFGGMAAVGAPTQQPPVKLLKWLPEISNLLQHLMAKARYRGMYEVLAYETTLELKDRGGKKATFKKREKVRYLQDNVIAYQDQAWGDGEILINYRCTPGMPVDQYRSGYKTYIIISRREVKNKGDIDEFNIEWGIRQGFLRRTEQWETHVKHPTKHLTINVIFPKSRPLPTPPRLSRATASAVTGSVEEHQ